MPVVARRYGARIVAAITRPLRRRHGCAVKRVARSRYYQRTVSVTRSVACPPQGRAGNEGPDVSAALLPAISRSVGLSVRPSVWRSVGRSVGTECRGCMGGPEHDPLLFASRRVETIIRVHWPSLATAVLLYNCTARARYTTVTPMTFCAYRWRRSDADPVPCRGREGVLRVCDGSTAAPGGWNTRRIARTPPTGQRRKLHYPLRAPPPPPRPPSPPIAIVADCTRRVNPSAVSVPRPIRQPITKCVGVREDCYFSPTLY